jgi:hypothetical protein
MWESIARADWYQRIHEHYCYSAELKDTALIGIIIDFWLLKYV